MDTTSAQTPSKISHLKLFILSALGAVGIIWVFGAGVVFSLVYFPQEKGGVTNTVSPTPSTISPKPLVTANPTISGINPNIQFVPFSYPLTGAKNSYFNDTLTVLALTDPPQMVISTYVIAQNNAESFTHQSRVSYFDGNQWHRNTDTDTSSTTAFVSNKVITGMNVLQDQNRVLRQMMNQNITVDSTNISIATGILENEITMRTEPTYTRTVSDSTGEITINGIKYPAKIMYNKWYSMDKDQLSVYNADYGLNTHVVDFWAEDGSVLHLDSTQVKNPNAIYSSHQIGIYKDKQGRVAKTFEVDIQTSDEAPPTNWQVNFKNPLNIQFSGNTFSSLKRPEGENYDWYRGLLNGEIKLSTGEVIKGIGTFEYINEF